MKANAKSEVVVSVPMITESMWHLDIVLHPGDTAKELRRLLHLDADCILCHWPARFSFKDDEDVYDAVVNEGCSIYVRSRRVLP